ncbi:MAG: helix-turn-helix domain-containing protein [Gammaproteobacteria bacterium]|nr:helix-turn-helix domain-containing protein [Gammaproteobacteria bacterium]
MAKKIAPLLPSTEALLSAFSDRLRLARLRRRLPAKQVAAAAGMSPMTLRSLERGGSGVTIGAYLSVMQVLGIEEDLNLLAHADPVGRQLQDARLPANRSVMRTRAKAVPNARGGDPADAGVAQLRSLISAVPDEQLRRLFASLGQAQEETPRAVPLGSGQPRPGGETAAGEGVAAPVAMPSPQITFDWLDAPASDLKRLVKPVRETRGGSDQGTAAQVGKSVAAPVTEMSLTAASDKPGPATPGEA